VRLIDISLGGALVAGDEPMGPPGTTGQLRVPLSRGRFEARVVVNREEIHPTARPPVLTATAIVNMGPESQDLLEDFLGGSK